MQRGICFFVDSNDLVSPDYIKTMMSAETISMISYISYIGYIYCKNTPLAVNNGK